MMGRDEINYYEAAYKLNFPAFELRSLSYCV